jgi:tellurite resistance protein
MLRILVIAPDFDRMELGKLLGKFRANCRRLSDRTLADRIETELLKRKPSRPEASTYLRLAKWCRTDGNAYQEASTVAREISVLLFGRVLDRRELGV